MNRRLFVSSGAGVVAAAVTSTGAAASVSSGDARARSIYVRRVASAARDRDAYASSQANGDELRIHDHRSSFSKGLPHRADGVADPAAFAAFVRAIDARDPSLLDPRTSAPLRSLLGTR